MAWLVDVAHRWYLIMSQLSVQLSEPLQQFLRSQNMPGLSALLLGVLGGLAPCQVTANAGAIAYVTQSGQEKRSLWRSVGAFIAGKAAVYILLGFLAAMLGFRLSGAVMGAFRKVAGPLFILIGLYMFGVFRFRGQMGGQVTEWLRERAPRRGHPGFWLGAAFSLGFCPTMALIFFGALVPLVINSQVGFALPAIFAVGTALPVILWALALTGGQRAAGRWLRGVRNADRYIRWGAAIVFLLAGLNDTVIYWLT